MAHNPKPALNSSSMPSPKKKKKKALSQRRATVVTKTPSPASAHTVTVNDLPVVPTVAPTYNIKDSSNVTDVFSPQSLSTFVKPASAKTGYRVSNPTLLAPGRSKAVTSAPTLKAYDLSVRPLPAYVAKTPAISVVVPMYNAEEYITECLESLLHQTFQDFEVIVVDDCSTDNSVKIVESYAPKFNGRLQITHTETNSGGGGYIPRNIGFKLARGEYIYFMDADDFILLTALETLYEAAKNNDADVVYTSAHYQLRKPNDFFLHRDGAGKKLIAEGQDDETDLIIDNPNKILRQLLTEEREGNFRTTWSKFVRRSLLIENEIVFPIVSNGADFIWCINVYCHARRFLRLPTPIYFYRRYNTKSITQTKRKPSEQISYWTSGFVVWTKCLSELENKTEILSANPVYCLAAMKSHFNWSFLCMQEARSKLSPQEFYELLCHEFTKEDYSSKLLVTFLFSTINADRKDSKDNLQIIDKLKKELNQSNKISLPAVSVIIPMYNASKYVGECLDSLLAQTFQNFEVIVVDDCSTDNSVKIVESYAPKFNGRLQITHTETNSGGCALPRNKGLTLSRGEYVFFIDADDMLTNTALEELHGLAKKEDAEIVWCEQFYETGANGKNKRVRTYQKGKLVDKPTLEPNDLKERVRKIVEDKYVPMCWTKFVRRDFITRNEFFFPHVCPSEDNIWGHGLIFQAKRILRVPNVVYMYRQSEDSSQREKRTPQQNITFWLNPVMLGLKALDALMNRHEFFKTNPSMRIEILKKFITTRFDWTSKSAKELTEDAIYSTIRDKFGEKLGEQDVLVSALCAILYKEKESPTGYREIADVFKSFLPARIDILFKAAGEFKILSVSDNTATIEKPEWFQKNGVGYVVHFHAEKLKFVAKATVDGHIYLRLEGISAYISDNKSKRIPCYVDYKKLTINGKTIFNTLTSVWHDAPYRYEMDVKAGEEITIQVERVSHGSDTQAIQQIKDDSGAKLVEQAVLINALCALLQNEQNARKEEVQIIDKFSRYFTARIDLKLMPKTRIKGNFQILSMSDNKAEVSRPSWFQKNGKGYVISSYAGNLNFVAKSSVTGQIQLVLLGLDVRDPKNKSKRIPYWIDYTKLVVNGKTIFDELTPCWHNEPYSYNMNVKAGEEIKIQVEWLPHRSDT